MLRRLGIWVAAAVVTLAVALPAAPPAGAQEAGSRETVTVTFRLSVDGQVPGWQHFGVDYPVGGEKVDDIPLCTTGTDSGMAAPPCRSGEAYTASVEMPAGTPLAFDFVRSDTRTAPERFKSETRTFTEDATVSAAYHFPGGEVSGIDGETTPQEEYPGSPAEDQYAAVEPPSGSESPAPPREYPESTAAATGNGTAGNEGVIPGGLLPDTGGATLLVAGAGALLTAAGLLVYRRVR